MTSGEAALFGRGQFPRRGCVMSWGNECPSPGSHRESGWKTTALAILVYMHNNAEVYKQWTFIFS